MNNKKILMLIPELGYGGAEKAFIQLSNFLSEFYTVTIVVFNNNYNSTLSNDYDLKISPHVSIFEIKRNSNNLFKNWYRRYVYLKKLKLNNHICISFLSGANLLNVITAVGTPTIVSIRGSITLDNYNSLISLIFWKYFVVPLTCLFSNRVVVASLGLKIEINKFFFNFINYKVYTIEGCVNTEMLLTDSSYSIEPEIEKLAKFPLLITCGRLDRVKGFNHLIRIFANVKKTVVNSKLLLIGDGPELNELISLCKNFNLSVANGLNELNDFPDSDVIFLGYRSKPIRYFKLAKSFILSSLSEGLPNVLIEAVGSGVWCIASDCSIGVSSILSDHPSRYSIINLPLDLEYGTLMPKIEHLSNDHIWTLKLIEILLANCGASTSKSMKKSAISRFDINNTGIEWLKIINSLH